MSALPKHDAQVDAVRGRLLQHSAEYADLLRTVRLPPEDVVRWLRHYQHLPDPKARLLVLWNAWRFSANIRLTFDEFVREYEREEGSK